ncbi:MAG: RNA polymerase sigma factor [Nannocystaceae bacterium]|nr:RNA polymerase sigma factor [Nannocystaceae bacterium]
MPDADDSALLSAWRAGDERSGQVLFERHYAAVFRFFSTKLGDATAADLTQKTFLAIVRAAEPATVVQHVRAYLLTAARNQLFMHFRQQGRRGTDDELGSTSVVALAPSPESNLAADEHEQRLLAALRALPLEQQMLLELYYFEQLGTEALAEVLQVPRGTVKSRLSRARAAARDAYEAASPQGHGSIDDLEQWAQRLRDAR